MSPWPTLLPEPPVHQLGSDSSGPSRSRGTSVAGVRIRSQPDGLAVLINPVLQNQGRRLAEVPKIPGDQYGPVCQRDAGGEQIRVADLSDGLHLTKPLELNDCSIIEGDDKQLPQQSFTAFQPVLGSHQLFGVCCLQQKVASRPQNLRFCDDGHANFHVVTLAQTFDNLGVAGMQVGESVGVQRRCISPLLPLGDHDPCKSCRVPAGATRLGPARRLG